MAKFLYSVVVLLSCCIRQFYLPNPFECFGMYTVLINWIAEAPIHTLCYSLVGIVYKKGFNPALGCILYLFAQCVVTGLLYLCGIHSFVWWFDIVIVILFIISLIAIGKLIDFMKKFLFSH